MEDLTLEIMVEYNIRSENENADCDQRGFPLFPFSGLPSRPIELDLKCLYPSEPQTF
jgi:hypothetical protein